jgi:anti-anti-sigma regulatory factor
MAESGQSATTLVIDVGGLGADAETVDALARLALFARRCGLEPRLTGVSSELRELIELCGLVDALLSGGDSGPEDAGVDRSELGR